MINRILSATIKDAYRYFPVITVTGPRQSGKTTMIRNMFSELPYYSLENLDMRYDAQSDPRAFLGRHKSMIIDEVQNVPDLLSYIQGLVDEDRSRRFILSGSSNFALLKKVTQSLAGRTAVFELLPLSFLEVKEQACSKSLDQMLLDGFYPEIYAGSNVPGFLYQSYVKTYMEKDVRDFLQIRDMMQFHTFIRLCAGRIGSLFNASQIATEVGVSVGTINSWLSVLEASYLIFMLPPYFENASKRLVKAKKLYFVDTGLACSLLGIETQQQLSRDRLRGALFENFVVIEALKNRYNQGKGSNLYFYRDSHQNEIDLMDIERDGLSCVEIKSAETYHPDFGKTLRQIDDWTKENILHKSIVYAGEMEIDSGDIQLFNYRHLDKILN